MKIQYVKNDLFETPSTCILHGCNAQGVMGSGVAKIIRDKYPSAYDRYRNKYEINNSLKMGDIIVVPCGNRSDKDYKIIINAITQEYYGRDGARYVSYDAVSKAMINVNRVGEIYGITEVAMPMIGAGLGGGDWKVIEAIIESELKTVKPIVYYLE